MSGRVKFIGLAFLVFSGILILVFKNSVYAYINIIIILTAYILWTKMHFKYEKTIRDLESSKTNFISLISHELKTPITSIKGFSEVLIRGEAGTVNDMQKDFLTTIIKSIKDLETKVDNIIELSNFGKKRVTLKKERVDWNLFLKEIIEEFKRNFEYKRLTVEVNIDGNIGFVLIDKEKLQNAFNNILLNAIKFTEPEGIIKVNSYRRGDFFETTIIDTGRGITKELQHKIFETFVQTDDLMTRDYNGLGIGLTLTKSIINNHSGQIYLNNTEEGGTKVTFILPIGKLDTNKGDKYE